jgi:hypothetical protein
MRSRVLIILIAVRLMYWPATITIHVLIIKALMNTLQYAQGAPHLQLQQAQTCVLILNIHKSTIIHDSNN